VNFDQINKVHFIGIGGIGMSALARYFKSQGKVVSGYDKTETVLTQNLVAEGIHLLCRSRGSGVDQPISRRYFGGLYTCHSKRFSRIKCH
jgi:UDP-N-acetylmuramate-alanine ligase